MEIFVRDEINQPKVVKVEHGLKVEIRDSLLKIIQEEDYIKNNFKLNIKRINRWWYSVYFDKKED